MPLDELGDLRSPLEALGALLLAAGEPQHLLVVGGVAMLVRRIRVRATADVEVIARAEVQSSGDVHLVPPDPLPEALERSVERVARDFGPPADWSNTVVGRQWEGGPERLPPGLVDETTWHTIGGLHLGIAGRRALLALKLYAAVDTGPRSVHTQDLLAMMPSEQELLDAADWARRQDVSPEFAAMLAEVVEHVRHGT